MATPKSHSLNSLLSEADGQLTFLTTEARRRLRLCDQVRRRLAAALAPHCLGATLESGTLVIYMDSAAAATPVRYQQRELLARLSADISCTTIQVRVLPDASVPTRPPGTHGLPEAARTILENTAASLEDGPLSRSLRHLARNRTPRR